MGRLIRYIQGVRRFISTGDIVLTTTDIPESNLQNSSGVGAKELAEGMEFGKKLFGKSDTRQARSIY